MENSKVLIDTTILIDYLRSKDKSKTQFIKLFHKHSLCASVITIFELYNGATDESKLHDIDTICKSIEIIDFNLLCAKRASEIFRNLRKQNQLIEFRDILIGATALENNLKVATKNKKHFKRISNLHLID